MPDKVRLTSSLAVCLTIFSPLCDSWWTTFIKKNKVIKRFMGEDEEFGMFIGDVNERLDKYERRGEKLNSGGQGGCIERI